VVAAGAAVVAAGAAVVAAGAAVVAAGAAVVAAEAAVVVTGAAVVAGGFVAAGVVVGTVLSVDKCAKSIVVPSPVAHTLKPAYRMLKSLLHTISAPCATQSPCAGA
jgi:hypothetical protein